jgi:hypothetical protein
MPGKTSFKVSGISYIVISFLVGYQLRATFDSKTNSQFIPETDDTKSTALLYQGVQREQLHRNSSQQHSQPQLQKGYPTIASRPNFSTTNPSKCERQWDWPFLDMWTQKSRTAKNQTITTFQVARSNAHETARGTIHMQVIQRNSENENYIPRRVLIFVSHHDAMGANAWHRIAVQYMVWIAWHVAEHRLFDKVWTTITNVELAMPCNDRNDIPQGWEDLLFPINHRNYDNFLDNDSVTLVATSMWCTNAFSPRLPDELVQGLQPLFDANYNNSSSNIDVILVPPKDGLMWDLAWDTTFDCKQSHMFLTFMSQFAAWQQPSIVPNTDTLPQTTAAHDINKTPVVCWILRYGNPQRDIQNRDEVHGMLLSIFDTVRLLHITRYHKSLHIRNIIDDCQVLYGVHGAGMVNAMWGTISSLAKTAVVEVLPENQPQYFRSVSGLVGHYYEGVITDLFMDQAQYHIDLATSADALRRALNYVTEI